MHIIKLNSLWTGLDFVFTFKCVTLWDVLLGSIQQLIELKNIKIQIFWHDTSKKHLNYRGRPDTQGFSLSAFSFLYFPPFHVAYFRDSRFLQTDIGASCHFWCVSVDVSLFLLKRRERDNKFQQLIWFEIKLADLVNTSYKDSAAARHLALLFLIRPSIIAPSGKHLAICSITLAISIIYF